MLARKEATSTTVEANVNDGRRENSARDRETERQRETERDRDRER